AGPAERRAEPRGGAGTGQPGERWASVSAMPATAASSSGERGGRTLRQLAWPVLRARMAFITEMLGLLVMAARALPRRWKAALTSAAFDGSAKCRVTIARSGATRLEQPVIEPAPPYSRTGFTSGSLPLKTAKSGKRSM